MRSITVSKSRVRPERLSAARSWLRVSLAAWDGVGAAARIAGANAAGWPLADGSILRPAVRAPTPQSLVQVRYSWASAGAHGRRYARYWPTRWRHRRRICGG